MMPTVTRTPRSSWIDAGLRALAAGGPDAVRIELLAQELGVTRGGFYWYFEGRDAFLQEMLDTWERRCTDEALERVQREGGDAREKVWRAGMFTFSKELLPIDLAVSRGARKRRFDGTRSRTIVELVHFGIGVANANAKRPQARRHGRLAHADGTGEAEDEHQPPSMSATMTARSSSVTSGVTPNHRSKPGTAWCSSMPRPSTAARPRLRAAASNGVSSGT